MFGSDILEVAIGLSFVFLLLSAVCSAAREAMEAWFKTRAVKLEEGIRELLRDGDASGLARHVYEHPLVYSLFRGEYRPAVSAKPTRGNPRAGGEPAEGGGPGMGRRLNTAVGQSNLPSYIPASNFAVALLDVVARGSAASETDEGAGTRAISVQAVRRGLARLEDPRIRRALLVALDGAQDDLVRAQANVEAWYNSAMDRVSGWYKRRTQGILFWLGLAMAIVLNVNTIHLADYLIRNDAERAALVARAEAAAGDSALLRAPAADTTAGAAFDSAVARLDALNLPIGWTAKDHAPAPGIPDTFTAAALWGGLGLPIFGWLLTALAVTLGAPFWFDLLNKFMVVRSTVKPHEKSPEEASEDRQRGGTGAAAEAPAQHLKLASAPAADAAGLAGLADLTGAAALRGAEVEDEEPPAGEEDLADAVEGAAREPAAALSDTLFSAARRRTYVDFILKNDDRFNFLRPAQQSWSKGQWLHSFEKDGKTFRVSADWSDTQKGELNITSPTAPGAPFGGAKATFCNFNVSYCYTQAYGGPCLQFLGGKERSANELVDLLTREWKVLTPAQAARIANAGGFVIAGKKATGHGHVVFLLEGSDESGKASGIRTFHVGGGVPRERTVADIWGDAKVHFVTPPETFAAWQAAGGS